MAADVSLGGVRIRGRRSKKEPVDGEVMVHGGSPGVGSAELGGSSRRRDAVNAEGSRRKRTTVDRATTEVGPLGLMSASISC